MRRDASLLPDWRQVPRIDVIGCGTIGSWVARILWGTWPARNERPEIWLVDDDRVSEPNLGTQFFTEEDLGRPKAEVLAERFGFTPRIGRANVLREESISLVGIDSMKGRLLLQSEDRTLPGARWIDGRIGGFEWSVVCALNEAQRQSYWREALWDPSESTALPCGAKGSASTGAACAAAMVAALLSHLNTGLAPFYQGSRGPWVTEGFDA